LRNAVILRGIQVTAEERKQGGWTKRVGKFLYITTLRGYPGYEMKKNEMVGGRVTCMGKRRDVH
jgi:hypothetical protein